MLTNSASALFSAFVYILMSLIATGYLLLNAGSPGFDSSDNAGFAELTVIGFIFLIFNLKYLHSKLPKSFASKLVVSPLFIEK